MILSNRSLILATIMMVAVSFLGAASPVFAAEIIPTASAQSAAVKSTIDQLGDKDSKLSDREKLQGVIEVLLAQVSDLAKSLGSLRGLSEAQTDQRDGFISFLNDAQSFLTALKIDAETADVKFIAQQLQAWREDTFNAGVSDAVDFTLVFQVKAVLRTAESRYLKIFADVARLEDLKILKDDKARSLLAEARLLLTAAADLRNQAEVLLAKDNVKEGQLRGLLNDSINKIKLAYKRFLDISQIVKDSLK